MNPQQLEFIDLVYKAIPDHPNSVGIEEICVATGTDNELEVIYLLGRLMQQGLILSSFCEHPKSPETIYIDRDDGGRLVLEQFTKKPQR